MSKLYWVWIAMILMACSRSPQKHPAKVVEIANQAAVAAGYQLDEFEEPMVSFNYTERGGEWEGKWHVFYNGKEMAPGNHFSVNVDDHTGDAQVHRGK